MSVLDSVLQLRTAGVWKTGHKTATSTWVFFQLSTCSGLPRIQKQISICIAKPKRLTLNNITSSFVYFFVIVQQFLNGLFTNRIAFLYLVQLFSVSCSIRRLRAHTPSQGFKVASISPNTSTNNWFITRLPDQLSLGKPLVCITRITKS